MASRVAVVLIAVVSNGCSSDGHDETAPYTGNSSTDILPDGSGGSGGADTCNDDPWKCPAGQTCWLAAFPTSLRCQSSGNADVGEACENVSDEPDCLDGLTCIVALGNQTGVCTPFCDFDTHPCAGGAACTNYTLIGTSILINACAPSSGSGGGGGQGGGPADAGAD